MPALPDVAKVLRVDLHQALDEDVHVLNRIYWRYTDSAGSDDLNTLANLFMTEWSSHIAPRLTNHHNLLDVDIQDLSSDTANAGISSHASVSGSVDLDSLPAGAAIVVNFKIGRRYRGGKPKCYISGAQYNELADAQTIGVANADAWAAAFVAFTAGVVAGAPAGLGTTDHVAVSYFHGFTVEDRSPLRPRIVPTLRGTPLVDPVLDYIVDVHIGSQRRRNRP